MKPSNIHETDFLRTFAVNYIQKWINTPYIWGGIDCSGLIHETLQAVGLEKAGFDCTANELYLKLKITHSVVNRPRFGALVFWFKPSGVASHVAMLVNEFQVCEAAGGDEDTKTEDDARQKNAYVRIRPLDYRGEHYKIIDPFEGWEE